MIVKFENRHIDLSKCVMISDLSPFIPSQKIGTSRVTLWFQLKDDPVEFYLSGTGQEINDKHNVLIRKWKEAIG